MSLTATDFWSIFDFALNQVMAVFTLADSVVIVDSPRFSIWSVMVSILFLTLVLSVLNWLRGAHMGSGGSNWDYIFQRQKEEKPFVFHESMEYNHMQAKGFDESMISYGKREK